MTWNCVVLRSGRWTGWSVLIWGKKEFVGNGERIWNITWYVHIELFMHVHAITYLLQHGKNFEHIFFSTTCLIHIFGKRAENMWYTFLCTKGMFRIYIYISGQRNSRNEVPWCWHVSFKEGFPSANCFILLPPVLDLGVFFKSISTFCYQKKYRFSI